MLDGTLNILQFVTKVFLAFYACVKNIPNYIPWFCLSVTATPIFPLMYLFFYFVTSYVSLCKCISTMCTLTSGFLVARHSAPYNKISLIVILQKCPLNWIGNPQLYKIPLACLPFVHPMLILLAITNLNTLASAIMLLDIEILHTEVLSCSILPCFRKSKHRPSHVPV